MTSGVPQGSVLGPTPFLVYINDIVQIRDVDSTLWLFADDIYREINSTDNRLNFKMIFIKFSSEPTNGKCASMHPNVNFFK